MVKIYKRYHCIDIMCGFSVFFGFSPTISQCRACEKRGGDESRTLTIDNGTFVFHRLAINGVGSGSQPFRKSGVILVCNGEIYNHKELRASHTLSPATTKSDCEVILDLYIKYRSLSFVNDLDGVFAFVIYDSEAKELFYARDKYGVRPMYISSTDTHPLIISSTLEAFPRNLPNVYQTQPSHMGHIDTSTMVPIKMSRWDRDFPPLIPNVKEALIQSVRKRMMSDRPIGCLLSGGLDSSLIASLVVKEHIRNGGNPSDIKTFSIGMTGSPDLKYAKIVADYLGTTHYHWEFEPKVFIENIPNVIRDIESYDTTTVRASVGNWLVARNIREQTDVKVVFNGDGADEVCSGYLYTKKAPSLKAVDKDQRRLLRHIHFFDVLRSDRCIASHGLEARTPFLDKDFVYTYSMISPALRAPKCVPGASQEQHLDITKWYLRKQFEGYLPEEILWRKKEAFSDGVSSHDTSWHDILKAHFKETLHTTEANAYQSIFEDFYGETDETQIIPYRWMPLWCDTDDPSARTIDCY